MPRRISVTLREHFDRFLSQQLSAGHYETANDVVWAGLRLLEKHETKVKALEGELVAGEESGEPEPFDYEAFKARKRKEWGRRHAAVDC